MNRRKRYLLIIAIVLLTFSVFVSIGRLVNNRSVASKEGSKGVVIDLNTPNMYSTEGIMELDKMVTSQKRQIISAFSVLKDEFTSVVKSIGTSSQNRDIFYSLSASQTDFPDYIRNIVHEIKMKTNLDLSSIYTGGPTALIYPENSCVFRTTIYSGEEVYCWIDLVFSEYLNQYCELDGIKTAIQDGYVTPIDSRWCVIIHFGY